RRVIDRPQKRDQGQPIGWIRDKMMSRSAGIIVLCAVQNLFERPRQTAVEIRRRFMHAQERWNVKTIRAKRSDSLGDVRQVGANLVFPSATKSKRSHVDQNPREYPGLCGGGA